MRSTHEAKATVLAGVALAVVTAGCGDSRGGTADAGYHPVIDPARFSTTLDNPFLPLVAGTVFRYTETTEDSAEDITITVSRDTRVVDGVTCVVVHDVAAVDGQTAEDTFDWFAQDDAGNVWYFGEATTAYDGATSTTAGSWEAGVGGAEPGIAMEAHPRVGDRYRQEYLAGEAEDMGEVLALGESASVPYGRFDDCVRTRDFTPLHPDQIEEKLYCRGVGQVQSDLVQGGTEHLELIDVTNE